MRRVRFVRLGARDYLREIDYSERQWGLEQARRLHERFQRFWSVIAVHPERGQQVRPGGFRVAMRREKLWILYRWDGGADEDPIIVAIVSQRRNLTDRAIAAYLRRK